MTFIPLSCTERQAPCQRPIAVLNPPLSLSPSNIATFAAVLHLTTTPRRCRLPLLVQRSNNDMKDARDNKEMRQKKNRESGEDIKDTLNFNDQDIGKDASIAILFIASIITSFITSVGTLWSEYSILATGCGPFYLPDTLERFCYFGVILVAGLSVFIRIVIGESLASLIVELSLNHQNRVTRDFEDLSDKQNNINNRAVATDILFGQAQAAEWASLIAVVGAFLVLGLQIYKGEQMDGLTGINVDMCRAWRES